MINETRMTQLSLNSDTTWFNKISAETLGIKYLKNIYQRIHIDEFNFIGMIVGKHRTGKSLTAVSLSNILDPTFLDNLEKRVVYFPNDFQLALKEIKQKNIKGGAIIWDEAGVGIPARDWYDIANKSINYTLQVFGRYLPIVIFVTPDAGFIDSHARKMFHGFYEMERYMKQKAIMRPFEVKYSRRSTKVYYQYSRFLDRSHGVNGPKIILKCLNIKPPIKEIDERYEIHSKIFKDKISEMMEERSEKFNRNEIDSNRMTMEEISEIVCRNQNKYLAKRQPEGKVCIDSAAIRYDFQIPAQLACHIKRKAEMRLNNVPEEEQIQ